LEEEKGRLVLLVVSSRLFVFLTAVLSNFFVGERATPGAWRTDLPFFNLFAVWDSRFYLDIAVEGYVKGVNWPFFPLYPLIIRLASLPLLSFVSRENAAVFAGVMTSNLLFAALVVYFYRLSRDLFESEEVAWLSALFLSVYPASVFFSALYTESLFLLLTVAALYHLERGEWRGAALLAFLSGLTRSIGFLVSIVFVIVAVSRKERNRLVYAAFPLLAPLTFMLYGYLVTGDPLVYLHSIDAYFATRTLGSPLSSLHELNLMQKVLNPAFAVISLLSILYYFKMRGPAAGKLRPYYIYSSVLFVLYLFSGNFLSFARYSVTIFPIFWAMAEVSAGNGAVKKGLLVSSLLLLGVGTSLFVNWHGFM